jgi:transposase
MQLTVKTLLNAIQHFSGFVYHDIRLCEDPEGRPRQVEVRVRAHAGAHALCSICQQPAPGYDTLPQRKWQFPPVWNIGTYFLYPPRRVECARHGVVIEHVPWSVGKRPLTTAMMGFLATWARRLSWKETAEVFGVGWKAVYQAVQWVVAWGLEHRQLEGIKGIGIDEIHWGKGKGANSFLTVIYQIDSHCRRLLWVGRRRSQATLRRGLAALGPAVLRELEFVCSDMWQPYLGVVAKLVGHACHVLDRFHITHHLNQAVDKVRRSETARLKGRPLAQRLKKMRWHLLKRSGRVRGHARTRLHALLASKLATARAWNLKDSFEYFWHYNSHFWAGAFLDYWCARALRSRLEPMQKVARMLRKHEPLILNWFKAKKQYSSGAVEGLNNKIRVVTRRSYGFRTYKTMETALFHTLGELPEPPLTHRFC